MEGKSLFHDVPPPAQADAVMQTDQRMQADPRQDLVVNLGKGAYRTENGEPYVFPVVRKAERELASVKLDKEYQKLTGNDEYIQLTQRLILGEYSPAVKENRVLGVQTVSGTNACRVGMEFIRRSLIGTSVYFSSPTWAVHGVITKGAGLEPKSYRYFDKTTRTLDLKGMIEDLRAAPRHSVVMLQPCAHNPTGVDPTPEQWEAITDVCQECNHVPFFDCAYQGFASGDLDKDAAPVRMFERRGFEMLIAQSFSKNMGLYGERIGCLSVLSSSSEHNKAIVGLFQTILRPMYSFPPLWASRIVRNILKYHRQEWVDQLGELPVRIKKVRELLYSELARLGTPGDWSFITKQIGMFSYTGLSAKQCLELGEKHHVYIVTSGRLNVAGLSTKTVYRVARAIHEVVSNTKCSSL